MNRLLFLIALLALTGCRSSRIVVPETSAVVTVRPDTSVQASPTPLPRVRVETMPERVTEYRRADTLSNAADVTAVVATRTHITVRTRQGEQTFRQPATGETLVLAADTAGAFVAGVAGRQERVVVPAPRPSLLDRLTTLAGLVFGALVVLLVVLIIYRIHR